ncbi:sporulation membrane protein YtaF [Moorella naiadis]|uniref:sporulation membrane protein YtaF n=1 Tax=Moorella naiadis (nom. illeg.) TaxID=3093670 RepID=UPI003D9C9AC1
MHFLTTFFLALSANLDNLGVALAYGTRGMKLPFLSNMVIALITSSGTLATMFLGQYIAGYLLTVKMANYLGATIILAAGFWVLFQSCRETYPPTSHREITARSSPSAEETSCLLTIHLCSLGILIQILRDPVQVDRDCSGIIDGKEAAVLGLALALNNLATGFGAGVSGLNPALTTAMVFLFSLFSCGAGITIGRRYTSRWLGAKTGIAAGLLLILIGVYELFI